MEPRLQLNIFQPPEIELEAVRSVGLPTELPGLLSCPVESLHLCLYIPQYLSGIYMF